MAGQIKMNAGELRSSATVIKNKNEDLRDTLNQINNAVINLVERSWKGDAATKTKDKMDEFIRKTFAQYTEAVNEYVAFINDTAQKYDTVEATISSNANQQMDSTAVGNFD